MNSIFHDYGPYVGAIQGRSRGSLVACEGGTATTYGLRNAEPRGTLFMEAGVEVYEGMVVGEHQRPGDLDVNICKTKQLDNMRRSFKEIDERLTPPWIMCSG